jgi:hypothetical protein
MVIKPIAIPPKCHKLAIPELICSKPTREITLKMITTVLGDTGIRQKI